ncbi:MAG: hypothetical protein AAFX87_27080 [Bacteroidota bacterium]
MKLILSICVVFVLSMSVAYAQVDDIKTQNSLFYYSGKLADKGNIQFNLQFNDHLISGSYILEESGEVFVFNGRADYDMKGIGIYVFNEKDVFVATIEAYFKHEQDDFAKSIEGVWKSANGTYLQKLNLSKIAEYAQITEQQNNIDPIDTFITLDSNIGE